MSASDCLAQWQKGIRIFHIAHYRAATRYTRLGRILGVPVIVLTTVVGTTIFTTLGESSHPGWRIAAGIVSMIAAILAGVQTFLNFPTLAEKHHAAGVGFARLRRKIDEFLAFDRTDDEQKAFVTETRKEWDALVEASPSVPQQIYDKARALASQERESQGT